MNILINYSHLAYYNSSIKNASSAISVGGFDKSIRYGIDDISEDYRSKNSRILSAKRGAGYWMWKPYIIHKTLISMDEDSVLFYCDAGSTFVNSAKPYIDACKKDKKGIILFKDAHINKKFTKRDCFVYMNSDTKEYTDALQLTAGFQFVRKTSFSLKFYEEYMRHAENENIISDLPNTCGLPNYPEYEDHRHDQSICTNLSVKHEITTLPDPSQFGDSCRVDGFPRIIDLHRNRQ